MAKATVCLLAISEGGGHDPLCPNCAGNPLTNMTVGQGGWANGEFAAPYKYDSRTLWTYRLDGADGPPITGIDQLSRIIGEGTTAQYLVPVGKGFKELCLFYDAEGGVRINVVAAISGKIVRPKGALPAQGTDENCPIENATLSKEKFAPGNFIWNDDQITKLGLKGAWTTTPGDGPGDMVLQAKAQLPTDKFFVHCRFSHWEFNLLTPTADPPTIEMDKEITFPRNVFAGLIAHYELVNHDADVVEPITKPGEITIGDPELKLFLVIGQHRVAYELRRLAEGSIRPIRNDPRSAAHGMVLKEPRVTRELRARIMRAARAAADLEHELRELLLQVPPPRD